jgi:hypothetical protein
MLPHKKLILEGFPRENCQEVKWNLQFSHNIWIEMKKKRHLMLESKKTPQITLVWVLSNMKS